MGLAVISANTTMKNFKRYSGAIATGTGAYDVQLISTGANEYLEVSHIKCGSTIIISPPVVTFSIIDNDSSKTIATFTGTLTTDVNNYSRIEQEMGGNTSQPKLLNMPPNSQLRMSGVTGISQTMTVTGRSIINSP
jgi:hypothetical protein